MFSRFSAVESLPSERLAVGGGGCSGGGGGRIRTQRVGAQFEPARAVGHGRTSRQTQRRLQLPRRLEPRRTSRQRSPRTVQQVSTIASGRAEKNAPNFVPLSLSFPTENGEKSPQRRLFTAKPIDGFEMRQNWTLTNEAIRPDSSFRVRLRPLISVDLVKSKSFFKRPTARRCEMKQVHLRIAGCDVVRVNGAAVCS